MIFDTHAHVNFNAYKDDADEVIRRSLADDVWLINVGSQYTTSKRAVEIAERYKNGVYAAVGLHPIHAKDEFQYEKYKELTDSKKTVAIGEVGLDYKAEYVSFKEQQRTVLCKQLDLAKELNLPVIFHCRMAHEDLLEILTNYSSTNHSLTGVVHCFTGNWEQAQKYMEMGLHLGFNGIIFSARGGSALGGKLDLDDIIKKTPLERILVETDCPYLTPLPMTGRNEPIFVKYVAEKIAKIKNLSYEEIAEITTQNAQKLFKI